MGEKWPPILPKIPLKFTLRVILHPKNLFNHIHCDIPKCSYDQSRGLATSLHSIWPPFKPPEFFHIVAPDIEPWSWSVSHIIYYCSTEDWKKPQLYFCSFQTSFRRIYYFPVPIIGPIYLSADARSMFIHAALQGCIKCYGPKIRPKCFRGELALFSFALGPKTRSFSILCTPATTHNEYLKQKDFYRIFHHRRATSFMF